MAASLVAVKIEKSNSCKLCNTHSKNLASFEFNAESFRILYMKILHKCKVAHKKLSCVTASIKCVTLLCVTQNMMLVVTIRMIRCLYDKYCVITV